MGRRRLLLISTALAAAIAALIVFGLASSQLRAGRAPRAGAARRTPRRRADDA